MYTVQFIYELMWWQHNLVLWKFIQQQLLSYQPGSCLFEIKNTTSITFNITFHEQIRIKFFQVEHPQISLIVGSNFTLLNLNNAEILLQNNKYWGKLKKGLW